MSVNRTRHSGKLMTTPKDESEDLTQTDKLVERTGNGLMPEDPDDQPTQDPAWLPPGTVSNTEIGE